jgi:hypothetical protein
MEEVFFKDGELQNPNSTANPTISAQAEPSSSSSSDNTRISNTPAATPAFNDNLSPSVVAGGWNDQLTLASSSSSSQSLPSAIPSALSPNPYDLAKFAKVCWLAFVSTLCLTLECRIHLTHHLDLFRQPTQSNHPQNLALLHSP